MELAVAPVDVYPRRKTVTGAGRTMSIKKQAKQAPKVKLTREGVDTMKAASKAAWSSDSETPSKDSFISL